MVPVAGCRAEGAKFEGDCQVLPWHRECGLDTGNSAPDTGILAPGTGNSAPGTEISEIPRRQQRFTWFPWVGKVAEVAEIADPFEVGDVAVATEAA